MRVRLSSEARQDLFAIGDYIARDNPPRAQSFVAELAAKCASLGEMPRYGRKLVTLDQAAALS